MENRKILTTAELEIWLKCKAIPGREKGDKLLNHSLSKQVTECEVLYPKQVITVIALRITEFLDFVHHLEF
jgi:hypothetical protein